jgi:hypothetical protein
VSAPVAPGSTAAGAPITPATVPGTTVALTGPRSALAGRLTRELGDAQVASTVAAGLEQDTLDGLVTMTGGDLAGSPQLTYTPSTVPDEQIDSLWVFSFGDRIDPASGHEPVTLADPPVPMDEVSPGPVNEALAHAAADFVRVHPVPIIAQWEVARVLQQLGVPNVISVEPPKNADGSVAYLNTPEVSVFGQRLAAARGTAVGHAGILCVKDMAVTCELSARATGLHAADVPAGVTLPSSYDPDSGQLWTRSMAAWIPIDLFGRTLLPKS